MKTKKLVAVLAMTMAFGLTACGNPLKTLPEEGKDNVLQAELEEETEDLVDDIIDAINEGEYRAEDTEYTSFVVTKRKDDEDEKTKSKMYVALTRDSEFASLTDYFIVDLKYSKDRGWKVKGYERNTDESAGTKVEPIKGPSDDTIKNDLANYYLSYSDYDNNIFFTLDNTADIVVSAGTIKAGDDSGSEEAGVTEAPGLTDGEYNLNMPSSSSTYVTDFTYTLKNGFTYYSGSGKVGYTLSNDGSEWRYYSGGLNGDLETTIDESVAEELSDDRMINDLESYEFDSSLSYVPLRFKMSDFSSYEFGACAPVGNNCDRVLHATVDEKGLFGADLTFTFNYTYENDQWKFNRINLNKEIKISDDMVCSYSGSVSVYDTKKHTLGTSVGTMKIAIDGYDMGHSTYSGYLSYESGDNTIAEIMPFNINSIDGDYVYVDFTKRDDGTQYLIFSINDRGYNEDTLWDITFRYDYKGNLITQFSTSKHGNVYIELAPDK
ncbi:MAG: hypothetical protein K5686_02720 [Lachnospiraceae bacterium]|nr:hypothetical protein [Lachnospiraceae bacterium]